MALSMTMMTLEDEALIEEEREESELVVQIEKCARKDNTSPNERCRKDSLAAQARFRQQRNVLRLFFFVTAIQGCLHFFSGQFAEANRQ